MASPLPASQAHADCYCGNGAIVGSRFCPDCVEPAPGALRIRTIPTPAWLPKVRAMRTLDGHALLSFAFGLFAWFGLPIVGAIVAIWAGVKSLAAIRARGGTHTDRNLARAGIVLGGAQLLLLAAALAGVIALVATGMAAANG